MAGVDSGMIQKNRPYSSLQQRSIDRSIDDSDDRRQQYNIKSVTLEAHAERRGIMVDPARVWISFFPHSTIQRYAEEHVALGLMWREREPREQPADPRGIVGDVCSWFNREF